MYLVEGNLYLLEPITIKLERLAVAWGLFLCTIIVCIILSEIYAI